MMRRDRNLLSLSFVAIIISLVFLKKTDADFHLGFSLRLFQSHPSNRLADGSCCEPTCTSCNTILNFCFRDSQHPHQNTNLDTCFLVNERDTTSLFIFLARNTPPLSLNLTGSFQLFVNVIHVSDIVDHQQGKEDVEVNLIDNAFLEFTNLVPLPFNQASFVRTVLQEATGDFGRVTINVGVNVICAQDFNGSDCSTLCREIDESLVCEQVQFTTQPIPVVETTTTTEVSNTTEGDSPVMLESDTVAIAVGVSVGVAVFAVFMFIGLTNGFRYILQKIKGYDKDFARVMSTNKQSYYYMVDNVEIQSSLEVTK